MNTYAEKYQKLMQSVTPDGWSPHDPYRSCLGKIDIRFYDDMGHLMYKVETYEDADKLAVEKSIFLSNLIKKNIEEVFIKKNGITVKHHKLKNGIDKNKVYVYRYHINNMNMMISVQYDL